MADFGLTEDMYGTNYFRRTTSEVGSEEKVPIRWMAPESIENNIYDEATDVVSNGIVHNLNLMLFTSHGNLQLVLITDTCLAWKQRGIC